MTHNGTSDTSLYFEDVVPNTTFHSATATVSEPEIIQFAQEWDPQPFHLSQDAARRSLFGTLVASGLQTLLLSFRLYNDIGLFRTTALAGAGLDGLRWLAPVLPGMVLHVEAELAAKRPTSNPARGLVTIKLTTFEQTGRAVLTLRLDVLIKRRDVDAPTAVP